MTKRAKAKAKAADEGGGHSGQGEVPGRTSQSVKVIPERQFLQLVKSCAASDRSIASEVSTLGGLIAAAAEKGLHKGAFGIFKRLNKMDAMRRAELLFHLDIMRQRAEAWDGPMGWNAEPDLFRAQGGDEGDEAEHAPTARAESPGIRGDQFPDDDKDLRPGFLREGSSDPRPH